MRELEYSIDERRNRGTLSENQQNTQENKNDHKRDQPPDSFFPEKSKQFTGNRKTTEDVFEKFHCLTNYPIIKDRDEQQINYYPTVFIVADFTIVSLFTIWGFHYP